MDLATPVPPVSNYVFFTNFRHVCTLHLEIISTLLGPLLFRAGSWPSDCLVTMNPAEQIFEGLKEKALLRESGGG